MSSQRANQNGALDQWEGHCHTPNTVSGREVKSNTGRSSVKYLEWYNSRYEHYTWHIHGFIYMCN